MREKLFAFMRDEMPEALPRKRAILLSSGGDDAEFVRQAISPEKTRARAHN
jgi:hypothetical protein